jgi:hypothetical protein
MDLYTEHPIRVQALSTFIPGLPWHERHFYNS